MTLNGMTNQVLEYLFQNWIETLLAIVGVVIGLFGLLRSRAVGIVAIQSHDISLISRDTSEFPAELDIRYRGASIPRLTSSTVFIWNRGSATIRRRDIAESNPLTLKFDGSVFNQRISCSTDESIQAVSSIVQDSKHSVSYDFEFLNPKDGFVMEILHAGDSKHPNCLGTIMNSSKRPQYWGHAWGASSKIDHRFNRFLVWLMLVLGLVMSIEGFFEEPLGKMLPPFEEPRGLGWIVGIFGICVAVLAGLGLWVTRLRIPSSLLKKENIGP